MIEGARTSIDIAAFYITDRPGSTLTPVLAAIAARARAGQEAAEARIAALEARIAALEAKSGGPAP